MQNKFNKSKKIILEFNQDNNFDSTDAKYGKRDDTIIKNVRWIINCAQTVIHNSYDDGSPRRIEMDKFYDNLWKQLESQLTKDEIDNVLNT